MGVAREVPPTAEVGHDVTGEEFQSFVARSLANEVMYGVGHERLDEIRRRYEELAASGDVPDLQREVFRVVAAYLKDEATKLSAWGRPEMGEKPR